MSQGAQTTTIKVSTATHDELKAYAELLGAPTLEEALSEAIFAAHCTIAFDQTTPEEMAENRAEFLEFEVTDHLLSADV